jgi:hypothetical protein
MVGKLLRHAMLPMEFTAAIGLQLYALAMMIGWMF